MELKCEKCKKMEEYIEINDENIQFECGFIRRMTIADLHQLFRNHGGER